VQTVYPKRLLPPKNRQRQGQMRGSLHCGGRCAAFGRDDGGLRLDEEAVVRYRKRCPTHRMKQRRDTAHVNVCPSDSWQRGWMGIRPAAPSVACYRGVGLLNLQGASNPYCG
jgi:hypothetical protein